MFTLPHDIVRDADGRGGEVSPTVPGHDRHDRRPRPLRALHKLGKGGRAPADDSGTPS